MFSIGRLVERLRREANTAHGDSLTPVKPEKAIGDNLGDGNSAKKEATVAIEEPTAEKKQSNKQLRHQLRRRRQALNRQLGLLENAESESTSLECPTELLEDGAVEAQESEVLQSDAVAAWTSPLWFRVTCDNTSPGDFLKSAKWSPTGDRIVTCSEELGTMRLYHCPGDRTIEPDLELRDDSSRIVCKTESVYDYAWYPLSNAALENSSLLVVSSRERPLQLWDVCNSSLRASYRAFDHVGCLSTANSVCFSSDSSKLIAGYDSCIRVFPIDCPGTTYSEFSTKPRKRELHDASTKGASTADSPYYCVRGIISSIVADPTQYEVVACGSFSGDIFVFDAATLNPVLQLGVKSFSSYTLPGIESDAHAGITQLKYSPCGRFLFCAFRRHNALQCYDLRNPTEPLWTVERISNTNQRIAFDVDAFGARLVSGSLDGRMRLFDLTSPTPSEISTPLNSEPTYPYDTINCAQFHPIVPSFVCYTTGQRRLFDPLASESDEYDSSEDSTSEETSVEGKVGMHGASNFAKPKNHLVVGYLYQ